MAGEKGKKVKKQVVRYATEEELSTQMEQINVLKVRVLSVCSGCCKAAMSNSRFVVACYR